MSTPTHGTSGPSQRSGVSFTDRLIGEKIREQRNKLRDALEEVQGDVYLWRIGEIDAETAMSGIRDTVECIPRYIL